MHICLAAAINYAALENLFIYMLFLASSLWQRNPKKYTNILFLLLFFCSFRQKLSKLVETFAMNKKYNKIK